VAEFERRISKTLETVPLAKAYAARDLLMQHLDARSARPLEEIKELLESDRYPLERVVQYMYLARCNAQPRKNFAENN